jgi:translation elongation factor EF-Tu-like GTPase
MASLKGGGKMFFGLFKKSVKFVKVKRKAAPKKSGPKKTAKKAASKVKPKKAKVRTKKQAVRVTKRKPAVKKTARKPVKARKAAKAQPQVIGRVTHYFPHVKAGVILLTSGELAVGDTLQIKGHTTNFKQKITSMQINNAPIKEAQAGQEIGILLKSRVRHNDVVYKM